MIKIYKILCGRSGLKRLKGRRLKGMHSHAGAVGTRGVEAWKLGRIYFSYFRDKIGIRRIIDEKISHRNPEF